MRMKIIFCLLLTCAVGASAQLVVTVSPPKIAAQKAIVELSMTNNLSSKIESARAICFLLNERGEMIGESARWVIGGSKSRPALEPKKGTSFNFVITSRQPFTTTNLAAKVSFNRLILDSGEQADPRKDVLIQNHK